MYQIKIVEKDCRKNDSFKDQMLSYRVSIEFIRKTKEIIITREYFRVGFRDGEKWDDFFFDFELGWRNSLTVGTGSIMTRQLNDKKYLERIENDLIKEYYKKCFKSIDNIDKELKKQTITLNKKKENYEDIIKSLDKTFRKEKMEKIINGTISE